MNQTLTHTGIRMMRRSQPLTEGAGVHLKRAFGYYEAPAFDPFLMLDDFRSNTPGTMPKGSPSIPIAVLKPSPISCTGAWSTRTAWATGA